jgi:outer membrane protein assembly factor BamB
MSTNGSFRSIQNPALGLPLILCLFFLLFATPGWSSDPVVWKGWRGPNQDFTVENGGLFPPGEAFSARVVWRKPLGQGYSPVSVDERMAVTMFSDGTSDVVIAFDASDGHELWRHEIGPKHPGRYGSMDGPISAPLIHNGRVIAVSPYGLLLALDAKTGKQLWKINLKESYGTILPYYGLGTSPQAYGDRVIVELGGAEGKAISLIDPATGVPIWTSVTDTIAYQSPSVINIDGNDQIIGVGNRFLTGLDPTTGKTLWQHTHEGRNSASGTEGGNLVFTGPNRFLWKDSGGSASLLTLGFGDHGYSVTELWNTRNIRAPISFRSIITV